MADSDGRPNVKLGGSNHGYGHGGEGNTPTSSAVGSNANPSVEYIEATEDDLRNLRHVTDVVPFATYFIVLTELCERFAFYGVSALFQNYVSLPYNSASVGSGGIIGGLGKGTQAATAMTTFFQFWCQLTPVFGAIFADSVLGKFRTIILAAFLYAIGMIVLTVTSLPMFLESAGGNVVAMIGFISAMCIIGVGAGGIKPNISAMVAEQQLHIRAYVRTLPTGERVVVDPSATVQRIFNWFYWAINVGSLSSIGTTLIERYVNFWPAFLVPTAVLLIGVVIFIAGNRHYRHVKPTGSILMVVVQALRLGVRRGREAEAAGRQLVHTRDQYRPGRLDWAKPSTFTLAERNSPYLRHIVCWNDVFIDELKRTLKACKVFLFFPIYWMCYVQMTNTLISQAATMNTHQLPNDLMQNINPIVLIILIPVVDLWIYPLMGKWGIKFRPISRMTAGFMCGAMSMAYSAVIQDRIYSIYQHDHSNSDLINSIGASSSNSSDISSLGSISSFASIADVAGGNHSIQPQSIMYPTPTSPANISICWQIPSYALISISEIFALITGLEYAFNKAPASMKAVVVSLFMLTGCFGAVLNYAFIPLVKDPYITVMYGVIAGITAVLTLLFRYIFRDYDREEAAENVIGCH